MSKKYFDEFFFYRVFTAYTVDGKYISFLLKVGHKLKYRWQIKIPLLMRLWLFSYGKVYIVHVFSIKALQLLCLIYCICDKRRDWHSWSESATQRMVMQCLSSVFYTYINKLFFINFFIIFYFLLFFNTSSTRNIHGAPTLISNAVFHSGRKL